MATVSARPPITRCVDIVDIVDIWISIYLFTPSFPFANIFSLSDGELGEWSSGVPYIYLTPMELSAQDLQQVTSWVSRHNVQRRPLLSPRTPGRA